METKIDSVSIPIFTDRIAAVDPLVTAWSVMQWPFPEWARPIDMPNNSVGLAQRR